MNLQDQLKSWGTLVDDQVTAIQAKSEDKLQVNPGSVVLAIAESNSDIGVWLQSIIIYLYAYARGSTCVSYKPGVNNPDLDSWILQLVPTFTRLPAAQATTNVVLSRASTTQQAIIPVEPNPAQVTTQVSNIMFNVVKDATNSYWNETLKAYVVPAGTATITVPVQAVVGGANGNVLAHQINMIVTSVPMDSVDNPADVTNGKDVENDPAYLKRFQLYINNLEKATPGAINAAVAGAEDGILFNVIENKNYALQPQLGFFTVVIDDGSGNPPDSLVDKVNQAMSVTRALGIQWGVYKTVPVTVTVSMTLVLAIGYDETAIQQGVTTAIETYINNLKPGETLDYTKLPRVIYDVSQGIVNIENLRINSATADVAPTAVQSIKAGAITITFPV